MENEEYNLDPEQVLNIAREAAKAQFVVWCNEGYEMLKEGSVLEKVADKEEANLAMRRMLGLFIDNEEYEKCQFIKKSLDKHFPGETEPLFDYRHI